MDNRNLTSLESLTGGIVEPTSSKTELADEAVKKFFGNMTPIDPTTEAVEFKPDGEIDLGEEITKDVIIGESNQKIREAVRKANEEDQADVLNMLDNVAKAEERRSEVLDEADGAAVYKQTLSSFNDNGEDGGYVRSVNQDDLRRSSGDPDYAMIDEDDFTPDFDSVDAEQDAKVEAEAEEENYDDPDNVRKILAEAKTIEFKTEAKTPVRVIKERKSKTEIVSTGRLEAKTLADQAFINSANRFKQKNFRTVRVPLVNSGFYVDMVGTGANDLVMLYDSTDRRIGASEYEMTRMKTIMQSVVGTEPKVAPNELKNLIHHRDYQMMAYAHLCATLDEVIFPHTCDKCNRSFKVKANPVDLLLNLKELEPRIEELNSGKSVNELSLMGYNLKESFPSGFEVVIGHPSYYDEVVMLNALNHYVQSLKPIEAIPMAKMANTLLYIRQISLPNGLRAANVYQTFKALRLMELDELEQVNEDINRLTESIVAPKFGVANIVCPSCHEVIDTIEISGVDDLVFFLIMVTQAEKENTKRLAKSGTNS